MLLTVCYYCGSSYFQKPFAEFNISLPLKEVVRHRNRPVETPRTLLSPLTGDQNQLSPVSSIKTSASTRK